MPGQTHFLRDRRYITRLRGEIAIGSSKTIRYGTRTWLKINQQKSDIMFIFDWKQQQQNKTNQNKIQCFSTFVLHQVLISTAYRKTTVTPLLTHWSHCSLNHRYVVHEDSVRYCINYYMTNFTYDRNLHFWNDPKVDILRAWTDKYLMALGYISGSLRVD